MFLKSDSVYPSNSSLNPSHKSSSLKSYSFHVPINSETTIAGSRMVGGVSNVDVIVLKVWVGGMDGNGIDWIMGMSKSV